MKDYAKYSQKHSPNSGRKIFLILCILISLTGLIYLSKDVLSSYKPQEFIPTAAIEKLKAVEGSIKEKKSSIKKSTPAKKTLLTEKQPLPKPKFDFYTLLPQMKMSSTVEESPALQSPAVHNSKEYFVLQIASLQSKDAAEELIGRLNLLGVEASMQSFQRNGKTWIRVVSKPFTTFQEAQNTQDRLHQHHIESLLVKAKGY